MEYKSRSEILGSLGDPPSPSSNNASVLNTLLLDEASAPYASAWMKEIELNAAGKRYYNNVNARCHELSYQLAQSAHLATVSWSVVTAEVQVAADWVLKRVVSQLNLKS